MHARRMILLLTCSFALFLAGCGAASETALQAGDATLRTLIDLFLTDLANDLAGDDTANDDDADDTNDDADDADDNTDSDDPVARGEALMASNCAACHGADGASGFTDSIQGVGADAMDIAISGDEGHMVYDLSDQEVEDILAFLNSF